MPPGPTPPPIALSIAGSDPSGGAGVQADLKVFHRYGVYGTAVIASLTVQNTLGVRAAYAVETATVAEQLDAVLEDLPPTAAKTGALGSVGNLRAVARRWSRGGPPLVVDPVLVSSSGRRLLEEDALDALRHELLPRARLVTPNHPELEVLVGRPLRGEEERLAAGQELLEQGAGAVLLKGGHPGGEPADPAADEVVDLLLEPGDAGPRRFVGPRRRARHDHGTGCVLSAAIVARLAAGAALEDAVAEAVRFVKAALRSAPGLGGGRGPLDLWAE